MKKALILLAAVLVAGLLTSCGAGVPVKEMEDAKTAIERARGVDAPVFAAQEFMDAESDYTTASNFITNKQNQEAKEKAGSSKVKADKSYDLARERRADDIVQKNASLLDTAEKNFAAKLLPDRYQEAKNEFEGLKAVYEKKDYDATWAAGSALKPKLEDISSNVTAQVDESRNAIARAQDKFDTAESKDIVKDYALEDLRKAIPLLDEARNLYSAVDLAGATKKAQEAEALIDAADAKATAAYEKAQALKGPGGEIDLEKQKELEAQKKKAADYIDQAKKRLEQIRNLKKSGSLRISTETFAYTITGFAPIAQDVSGESETVPAGEAVSEDDVSQSAVEKYIALAEEAFGNEEYLDAIDYSREAIRIADIILASEQVAIYVVKLRPSNRDCLWKISGYMYESRYWLWPVIWRANKFQIQDPDLIYPGQKLKIPPALER